MSGFLSIFDLFFKVTIVGTPQQHPASNALMERVGGLGDSN